MKNQLVKLVDKIPWRKRAVIETVHDQLKNIGQIEHSRHRSPFNFLVNTSVALWRLMGCQHYRRLFSKIKCSRIDV